jgi:hypothetical protein
LAAFIWKTPKTSCVPGQINLKSDASNPEPVLVFMALTMLLFQMKPILAKMTKKLRGIPPDMMHSKRKNVT